jgi:crooked neck
MGWKCFFSLCAPFFHYFYQYDPTNSFAWTRYAELESELYDFNRARAIFELGVSQSSLHMPELLWKAYIGFEFEESERERAGALYDRLVELAGHVKVWLSYAQFESDAIPVLRAMPEEEEGEREDAETKEHMCARYLREDIKI